MLEEDVQKNPELRSDVQDGWKHQEIAEIKEELAKLDNRKNVFDKASSDINTQHKQEMLKKMIQQQQGTRLN